jgi:hypothetical protein
VAGPCGVGESELNQRTLMRLCKKRKAGQALEDLLLALNLERARNSDQVSLKFKLAKL